MRLSLGYKTETFSLIYYHFYIKRFGSALVWFKKFVTKREKPFVMFLFIK